MPPDECIEIALWDRFGWSESDTDRLTLAKMRKIFLIIEQEKVSRDAMENLGKPNYQKMEAKLKQEALSIKKKDVGTQNAPSNSAVERKMLRQL